jgi:manganese transport protein
VNALATPTAAARGLRWAPDAVARAASRTAGRIGALCGPGLVVAVAYVDPGNFATNTQAGAALGTRLVWVVVAAGLAAMLVQYLSAKLGAVTGRSLPELCRERYGVLPRWLLWAQAEVVTMATDLAEVLGGAIALQLLFGIPLPIGGGAVAAAGVALLALRPERRGRFDVAVAVLLVAVVACFAAQTVLVGGLAGTVRETVAGLRPSLAGDGALLLATGIIGATVMPHAVYLHSGLARREPVPTVGPSATHAAALPLTGPLRRHRRDIAVALGVAGLTNVAILVVAAQALRASPGEDADPIAQTFDALGAAAPAAGALFGLALLVAALAASGVGTLAGDVVLQGFWRRRIPLTVRRLVTLAPTLGVLALGVDPTWALVLSQVVLACGVPFALVPLLRLTADPAVMGHGVNRRVTTLAAAVVTLVVSGLDLVLVVRTVLG